MTNFNSYLSMYRYKYDLWKHAVKNQFLRYGAFFPFFCTTKKAECPVREMRPGVPQKVMVYPHGASSQNDGWYTQRSQAFLIPNCINLPHHWWVFTHHGDFHENFSWKALAWLVQPGNIFHASRLVFSHLYSCHPASGDAATRRPAGSDSGRRVVAVDWMSS